MEESGIAKGIRRIIAVTGAEARAAMAALAQFELRFNGVQGMTGKDKDEGFKTLTLVSIWSYEVLLGLLIRYCRTSIKPICLLSSRLI
jgi:hypothetical protein